MVEYEKIVGENHQNFLEYVLDPNGLVSLFIDNDWDVEQMPITRSAFEDLFNT